MNISPRNKISKMRSHRRHSTWKTINLKKLTRTYQITKCSNCGANTLAHRVCPVCGYYKGKQILTIKSASKETVVDA
ncbi:MAG: 50S ribosomal protein L32 [Candidatus Peribacteria bacterium]|nr:50S ribosomal protein L32 [Candidatus Peribacteria bacterium]